MSKQKQNKNPHNNFFIRTFSEREVAKGYIEEFLPKEIVAAIDLEGSLKLEQDSFINENLEEHFSDLVYSCCFKQAVASVQTQTYISFLFEHKSYPVKFIFRQLIQYILDAWERMEHQNEPYRLVIPIIVYHGEKTWSKKPMEDFFFLPNEHFKRYLPIFDYVLTDLSVLTDERILQLRSKAMLLNALMALKHGRNKEYVLKNLSKILAYSNEYYDLDRGENYFDTIFVYLSYTLDLKTDKIVQLLETLPNPLKKQGMNTYQYILKEGKEEGRKEGREEGRKEGKEEGRKEEKVKMIKKLLLEGASDTLIMNVTEITKEALEVIKSTL